MPAFFPHPLYDETVFSLFARYSKLVNFGNHKTFISHLFGRQGGIATSDLPGELEMFSSRLPVGSTLSSSLLLYGHTLAPYFLPFLPPDRQATLKDSILGVRRPALEMLLGLATSRVRRPRVMQFCPECYADDIKKLGIGAWRRIDQLPGVGLCLVHGCGLLGSTIPQSNRINIYQYYALTSDIVMHAEPAMPKRSAELLRNVTASTRWLLDNPISGPGIEALGKGLASLIISRGLVRRDGWPDARQVEDLIKTKFGADLLERLGCGFALDSWEGAWPRLLWRGLRHAHHPFRYLLILDAIGSNPAELLSHALAPRCRGPQPLDASCKRDRLCDGLKLIGPSTGISTCPNPVCDMFVAHYSQKLVALDLDRGIHEVTCSRCDFTFHWNPGFPSRIRIKVTGRAWDSALIEMLEAGVTAKGVAKRLGIAIATMQRHALRLGRWRPDWCCPDLAQPRRHEKHLNTLNQHKKIWTSLLASRPDASARTLRNLCPMSHRYLREMDLAWLQEHSPRPRPPSQRVRINWLERDQQLVMAARDVHAILLSDWKSPRRITAVAFASTMGLGSLLESRFAERLPLLHAFVSAVRESPSEFALRKRKLQDAVSRSDLKRSHPAP